MFQGTGLHFDTESRVSPKSPRRASRSTHGGSRSCLRPPLPARTPTSQRSRGGDGQGAAPLRALQPGLVVDQRFCDFRPNLRTPQAPPGRGTGRPRYESKSGGPTRNRVNAPHAGASLRTTSGSCSISSEGSPTLTGRTGEASGRPSAPRSRRLQRAWICRLLEPLWRLAPRSGRW